jgi:MFS family permease
MTVTSRKDIKDISVDEPNEGKVFIRDFLYTSVASFLFFSSFYLLLPIIPLYVVKIGGTPSDVGIALGIFPIASILARPFIGVFADSRGRKLFMIIGAGIFVLSAYLYSITVTLMVLFLLRLLHGFGMASFTTSSSAYIADIIPQHRRGEAMSYFASANNLALVIGPYIALSIAGTGNGFSTVFFIAAVLSGVCILLVLPLRETPLSTSYNNKFFDKTLYRKEVIFPSMVMGVGALAYAAIIAFLPIHAQSIDIGNPGIFFTTYGLSVIGSRIVASKLIDRYPRPRIIIFSAIPMLTAVALLAFTQSLLQLIFVAILFGLGLAFLLPSAQAYLIDRVEKEERAKALGVFFSFLELGIGGGAIVLGLVAEYFGYRAAFVVAAIIGACGIGFFQYGLRRNW